MGGIVIPDDAAGLARISNIILRVSDLKRSTAWYRDTLGLTLKFAFEGFAFFDAGGLMLALNENKSIAADTSLTEIVFETGDIHATFAALNVRGVAFTKEPRVVTSDATHDLLATDFRDPDGHVLSITVGCREKRELVALSGTGYLPLVPRSKCCGP